MDCAIHFWVYWEALQATSISVPQVSPYVAAKYQQILRFAIEPHSIYIQARWDPNQQWLLFPYKFTIEELDAIFQEWSLEWRNPGSQEELSKEHH